MDSVQPARTGLDLESWLRTPWKRVTLVMLLVLVAAAATTLQLHELQLPGGRRIGVADFLQRQPVPLG